MDPFDKLIESIRAHPAVRIVIAYPYHAAFVLVGLVAIRLLTFDWSSLPAGRVRPRHSLAGFPMRRPKKDRSGFLRVLGLITGMLIGTMLFGMPESLAFFLPQE